MTKAKLIYELRHCEDDEEIMVSIVAEDESYDDAPLLQGIDFVGHRFINITLSNKDIKLYLG